MLHLSPGTGIEVMKSRGAPLGRPRRQRTTITQHMRAVLERHFRRNPRPIPSDFEALANKLQVDKEASSHCVRLRKKMLRLR